MTGKSRMTRENRQRTIITGVLAVVWLLACVPATDVAAQGQSGTLSCRVTNNGAPATASIRIQKADGSSQEGSCGRPVTLAAGTHQVTVRLDGALDRPEQTQSVTISAGQTSEISASFRTGEVIVRVQAAGRPVPAMLELLRDGTRVATFAAGVKSQLSVGRFTVRVRFGGKSAETTVDVVAGESREVNVSLPE